jgi:CheY-like chemotaxis protein
VHVITGDENRRRGLALGAMTYLEKSVTKDNLNIAFDTIHHSLKQRSKKLLIIAPDEYGRSHWREALGGLDVETIEVGSGGEALAVVRQQYLDAIALDLRVTDIPAAQLVEEIQAETSPTPPVVVCGPRRSSADAEASIKSLARQSVVRYVESHERLLEETVLLLHRAEADLSESQRETLKALRQTSSLLAGKKVLVVDDDVRNIFALSTVLEQHGLQVVHAENGRTGIEMLLKTPGIDGVLMDIMMPEMDGYETMQAIRQITEFRSIPIVAVTAKAMKGDRAKCIDAGASDYITKPVDLEQLFSVLRVWLVPANDLAPAAMTVAG